MCIYIYMVVLILCVVLASSELQKEKYKHVFSLVRPSKGIVSLISSQVLHFHALPVPLSVQVYVEARFVWFLQGFCNFCKKKVLQFEDDVKMAPGTSKSSKIGPQEGAKRAQEGAKRTYVGLSCCSSSPCWGVLGLMWACSSNFERHL